jgi:hypothetical protein
MRAALITALLLLAPVAGTASAHVRSTAGYSQIRLEGGTVRYELSLERSILRSASGHAPSPEAYLLPRVRVYLDGIECAGALRRSGIESRQGRDYDRLELGYRCPGSASGAYTIRYGVFADGGVVDDHTNVAEYDLGGDRGTFVFDAGHRELDVGDTSALTSARRFAGLGVEHILSGIDHVLFLVALLLGASGFVSVLKLATAFTAAHSVTLALGALGWVQVPAEIVEPLIALSIAYVAAENVFGGASRHRLGVVFGFGLLHGLGFASSLSWSGDVDLGALVSFNAGIETGQALIIVALFPALLLIRRYRWSPVAHTGAAACAALLGLLWFVERLAA